MPSKNLSFKVYIEGIEVPFSECTISIFPNAPTSANISLIPSNGAFKLRPRSLVHVFYMDDFDNKIEWRLLWEGEIIGIGYSQQAGGSRSAIAQCIDLSGYWAHTKQYFMNAEDFGEGGKIVAFLGLKQVEVTVDGKLSTFYSRYFGPGVSILDSVLTMLRDFTDRLVFYSDVNSRVNLNAKIDAAPDEAVAKLIEARTIEDLVDQSMGHLGGNATILDIVNSIKGVIYYSHVNVGPPVFESKPEEVAIKTFAEAPTDGTRKDDIKQEEPQRVETGTPRKFTRSNYYRSFIFKPTTHFTIPPMCNVMFPDVISGINYSRSYISEPTRLKLKAHPYAVNTPEGQSENLQPLYFAPAELGAVLDTLGVSTIKSSEVIGLRRDDVDTTSSSADSVKPRFFMITEEELEKGVLSIDAPLAYGRYNATSAAEGEPHRNLARVAEYSYLLMKYESRSINIVGEFNPHVVADFPAIAFSAPRSYLFNVSSIMHTISGSGGSQTQISGTHTRELDADNTEDLPVLPAWISESYLPDTAELTYRKLLGCGSLQTSESAADGKTNKDVGIALITQKEKEDKPLMLTADIVDIPNATSNLSGVEKPPETSAAKKAAVRNNKVYNFAKLANRIYALDKSKDTGTSEWDQAEDKYQYADKYRRREGIATMNQVFVDHYGLSPGGDVNTRDRSASEWTKEGGGGPFDYSLKKQIEGQSTLRSGNRKIITSDRHKQVVVKAYVEEIKQLALRG